MLLDLCTTGKNVSGGSSKGLCYNKEGGRGGGGSDDPAISNVCGRVCMCMLFQDCSELVSLLSIPVKIRSSKSDSAETLVHIELEATLIPVESRLTATKVVAGEQVVNDSLRVDT